MHKGNAIGIAVRFTIAAFLVSAFSEPGNAQVACPVLVSATEIAARAEGDVQTIRASAFPCEWAVFSNDSWIFAIRRENQAQITLLANPGAAPRVGTVTVLPVNITPTNPGAVITVRQGGAGCPFTLSPQSITMPANGGSIGVSVTTNQGCLWTSAATPSWIALPNGVQGFNGSGILGLNAAPNSSPFPRIAHASVSGEFVQVVQKGVNTPELFADVPSSYLFFDYITLMRITGITSGCTATTYCPERTITRAELSVFIIRGLYGLTDFSYSPQPYFTDVAADHPFFPYIQKMKELGITLGCDTNPARFCPGDLVTRATAAAFVIRARLANSNEFGHPLTPLFVDVPLGDTFFGSIQKAKQTGITSGCTTTKYCPGEPLTRGQAAVFIIRGLLAPY